MQAIPGLREIFAPHRDAVVRQAFAQSEKAALDVFRFVRNLAEVQERAKTAVVYCRTSTVGQKEAETIQAQIARCRALIERHGVHLLAYGPKKDGWLIDDGVSGSLLEGRSFAELVSDLRARKVKPDCLIVYSLSRISRLDKSSRSMEKLVASAEDNARIKAVLLGAKVNVIDEQGEHDPGTVMFDLLLTLSTEEYRLIRSRTMSGKARRMADGQACDRPAYGYRLAPINGKDRKGGMKWEPHPEHADIVRQVLAWYLEGGSTHAARKATKAGYKSPQGLDRWASNTVEHMVKKGLRTYLGSSVRMLDGQSYELKYEPIIDLKTFAAVERRTRERTLKHRTKFLTTGYCDCECGEHIANYNSIGVHYARCRRGCGSIREHIMTLGVWGAVVARLVEIGKNEATPQNGTDAGAALVAAKEKVSIVQDKLIRLAEMREDGLDRATWKARNDVLGQSLSLAQAEVDRIVRERQIKERRRANEESVAEKVGTLLAALLEKDPPLERKRAILADLLQGERAQVSWPKRTAYGTSPSCILTLPAFGSLPPMTRTIDAANEEYTYQHSQLTRTLELQHAIRAALAS
jgi:DNA invertase Pin-like site-specific DNA recombinase